LALVSVYYEGSFDGSVELIGRVLETVEAIIYIDHILREYGIRFLLPTNMRNVRKVRFLLTALNIYGRVCRVEMVTFHQVQQLPLL